MYFLHVIHVLHSVHFLHITVIHSRHGIGAVIGKLGVEPLMNGGDQRLIFRGIGNFRAISSTLSD
jgi:hypothetical protein